ncbi:MAG TPA: DUF5667 domain-containing protein [Candidatus Limnocylindria bacterium]|nr:DUF5667 domain-containing protein [Candidatus Limnocylindria bacterium]
MSDRLPEPRMREEFRRELRAKLLMEAQTALAPRRRGTAWTSFLRPAVAVTLAGVVLVAGAGTAAAGSLPGDPAFGIKRAIEDLQVSITFDDVQRVQLLAQLADRRLAELQQVADREDKAPSASEEFAEAVTKLRAAVDALQQAAPQDKAEKAQDVADAARDKHDAIVDDLVPRVPEKAKDALERAKEEEHRDAGKSKEPKKTERPERSRTPEPARTPRPSSTGRATEPPRQTERALTTPPTTLRPSATPRLSATPRASGEQLDGGHD